MSYIKLEAESKRIKKVKRSIHDQTIDELILRLEESGDYDFIGRNTEYKHPINGNVLGEIDCYAFKRTANETYLLLFEVKSFNNQKNRTKAYNQLDRHDNIMGDHSTRTFKFYVTPKMIRWYTN